MPPSEIKDDAGAVTTAATSSSEQQQQQNDKSLHILDLPAVVLSVCFDFVGPGCFRYVAGTCRTFRDAYKNVDPALQKNWRYQVRNITTTTVNHIALSVSCAEFCFQEIRQQHPRQAWKALMVCEKIAIEGAASGSKSILLWAKEKGLVGQNDAISPAAARGGHFEILQWTYGVYGFGFNSDVSRNLVERDDLEQLQWALEKQCRADSQTWNMAIRKGNLEIINLIFESRAIGRRDCFHWHAWMYAGSEGKIDVLQWMVDHANEFEQGGVRDACSVASKKGKLHVLEWAQEQCPLQVTRWFNVKCCARAAYGGSLQVLQWLREHGCPWDGNTLYWAEHKNHLDILSWAKLHKCPETFKDGSIPYPVDRYL